MKRTASEQKPCPEHEKAELNTTQTQQDKHNV